MMNKRKVAFLVDGWYASCAMKELGSPLQSGEEVKQYCQRHLEEDDYLYRIYYYDTPPLDMNVRHPLTDEQKDYSLTNVAQSQEMLLASLKKTSYVNLRLGRTIWKGWKIGKQSCYKILKGFITVDQLNEYDVNPDVKQKGVDMMLGMDIAQLAMKSHVDKIVIISGDGDMAPAAKLARDEGVQVVLDDLNYIPKMPDDLLDAVDEVKSFVHEHLKAERKPKVKVIKQAS